MNLNDTKNLKKRYLVWFYKVTKEALDKIERKFTQAGIDRFLIRELKKAEKNKSLEKFIREFEAYVNTKEIEGRRLKFEPGKLKSDYELLAAKLKAIEKAIVRELGVKALAEIKGLYEREMIERILKSREH